ncbi:hypothetical protein AVEN_32342-1 [Araneus ventricosus]|uniref:Uncharacterized protein n=1 Tax=Araneus ventricosus TaxID=182803 RepID=A0A4Y2FJ62_ARAVE|nr:hypothetical protein AVEN_32342-1 [Araneus ventricosus]
MSEHLLTFHRKVQTIQSTNESLRSKAAECDKFQTRLSKIHTVGSRLKRRGNGSTNSDAERHQIPKYDLEQRSQRSWEQGFRCLLFEKGEVTFSRAQSTVLASSNIF